MKFKPLPPFDVVDRIFRYEPSTGLFYWKMTRPSRYLYATGDLVSGTTNKEGYSILSVRGYDQFFAHRLAWLLYYGVDPEGEIDHKNGRRMDNRIDNLRRATSTEQKRNKCVQSNNRSGLKGAYYHAIRTGKKWRSQIKVGNRLLFLGYFHTAEEAHAAYTLAEKQHFGEFWRGNACKISEALAQLPESGAVQLRQEAAE